MTQFCQTKSMGFKCLIVVILFPFMGIGCGQDSPTEPQITEEDIRNIIAQEVERIVAENSNLTRTEIAYRAAENTMQQVVPKDADTVANIVVEETIKIDECETLSADAVALYLNQFSRQIAQKISDSIVVLRIVKDNGRIAINGTGFVIAENQVVTAEHVVRSFQSGTARAMNSTTEQAIEEILAIDEDADIAILRVSTNLPPLPLGDSDTVKRGDLVFSVGHPVRLIGTFVTGVVSAVRPEEPPDETIQITAPATYGSSGSPVLNADGEVIGVITEVNQQGDNLTFCASINALKSLLSTIR